MTVRQTFATPLIVVVGNDHMMNRSWVRVFERNLGNRHQFETVSTEENFRVRFMDLDHLPTVVFISANMRWCDPAPKMTPSPPEVKKEGCWLAGYRCVEFLRSTPFTAGIPVMLQRHPRWEQSKPAPADPIAFWTLGDKDMSVVRNLQRLLMEQKEVSNS